MTDLHSIQDNSANVFQPRYISRQFENMEQCVCADAWKGNFFYYIYPSNNNKMIQSFPVSPWRMFDGNILHHSQWYVLILKEQKKIGNQSDSTKVV